MQKYALTQKFLGYMTKPDSTNMSDRFLISPSQNVLINDQEKVVTRKGYSLIGASDATTNPILSAYTWVTSKGNERALRFANGILQLYDTQPATPAWINILTGLSTTKPVRFASVWKSTEVLSELLFVNNSSTLYEWSGGVTKFASATAVTITKAGTETWAATGFLSAGTRKITLYDTGGVAREFEYTGGETTTTLTGISPDPTAFTFDVNATIFQSVRSNVNTPNSAFTNDLIAVLENQVYVGSETRRDVYVSKNTSFTDYTFSAPRVRGEGELLVLGENPTAFAVLNKNLLISAGRDKWYKTDFQLSPGSASDREVLSVKELKTGVDLAARSQEFVTLIGNGVAFMTFEPALRIIEQAETLENPFMLSLSNPIKPDFDAETWTNGSVFFNKNRIYVSSPTSGKVYINETIEDASGSLKRFWQPPQILPVRNFSIISDDLAGHSGSATETYKLFDPTVTADNEISYACKAVFPYNNYGSPVLLKNLDEWYTEGYIKANTELTLTLKFDYQGSTQILEDTIKGSDDAILFAASVESSLGLDPLGDPSIGGEAADAATSTLDKFRMISEFPAEDFFEISAEYSTDTTDAEWALLRFGGNTRLARSQATYIKQ